MSTGKSTACSPGIFSDGTKGFSGLDFAFDDLFLFSVVGSDFDSDPLLSEPDVAFFVLSGLLPSFAAKTIDSCITVAQARLSVRRLSVDGAQPRFPKATGVLMRSIDAAVTAISLLIVKFIVHQTFNIIDSLP